MKAMLLAILLLVLAPSMSSAADIQVGEETIAIPSPTGFGLVTPEMKPLYELLKEFVVPANRQFAVFIEDRAIPIASRGEIPDIVRHFSVQTVKRLVDESVSTADFLELRRSFKDESDQLVKKLESEMPGLMKQLNEGFTKAHSIDPAFAISQFVPMPAHMETDRALAFSMFAKCDARDEQGQIVQSIGVVTTTLLHLKGKVLCLYCYADESALEWSRQESRRWVDAILAANPPDARTMAIEARASTFGGFDWGRVGMKVVMGGLIGVAMGAIGIGIKKLKGK